MDYIHSNFCHPDRLGNYNWDINIRNLDSSDLYDGMYVQSFGNTERIYQLRNLKGTWYYRTTHRIVDRSFRKKDSKIEKSVSGWIQFLSSTYDLVKWSETVYSRKADPQHDRMVKLESLGI
jgi:hypothetical protein